MKKLSGRALWLKRQHEQRKWIEECEAGISYLGPNGPAIREADENELKRIQERLKDYPYPIPANR